MDLLSTAFFWLTHTTAAWLMAGIVAGVGVTLMERCDRRKEPTEEDIRRAAGEYRRYHGREAERVVGDHMLGASFAPDGRHRQFLKRVAAELLASAVSDEDRARAIDQ